MTSGRVRGLEHGGASGLLDHDPEPVSVGGQLPGELGEEAQAFSDRPGAQADAVRGFVRAERRMHVEQLSGCRGAALGAELQQRTEPEDVHRRGLDALQEVTKAGGQPVEDLGIVGFRSD